MAAADSVPSTQYVKELCAEWHTMLTVMYDACMKNAAKQDRLSGICCMIIIVLNVLIVGAADLGIAKFAVAIFVVVTSVVKATQMQFKFQCTAHELHEAKGGLREAIAKVDETSIMGAYGECSRAHLNTLQMTVTDVIAQTPGYVNIKIPKTHKLPSFSFKKKAKVDTVAAAKAEENSTQDIEAAPIAKKLNAEGAHAAPPATEATSVDMDALVNAGQQVASVGEQAASAVFGAAAVDSAERAVQEQTLTALNATMATAVKGSGKFCKLIGFVTTGWTTAELTLNSLIMVFSNVPVLQEAGAELVAVFAAVAAVLKGLEMKLELEVKQKEANMVHAKLKALQATIKDKQLDLDADGKLTKEDFGILRTQYQNIVAQFSSWIPH